MILCVAKYSQSKAGGARRDALEDWGWKQNPCVS